MYRFNGDSLEFLLAHPGGPYYEGKESGFWGIPKGQVEKNETIIDAAFREFTEETGLNLTVKNLIPIGITTEKSGKVIYAWAFPGDCDTSATVNSNLFAMEWPESSGQIQLFPEIDQLKFFSTDIARQMIEESQIVFIDRLEQIIKTLRKIA
jgi:predicted NUDIX family NTP pyrophosphohydrolase